MANLLDERDLTDAERAAVADDPRPGRWFYASINTIRGDGRLLSQDDTDGAIATELLLVVSKTRGERIAMRKALGVFRKPEILVEQADGSGLRAVSSHNMIQQRGGIHSDPIVRLLAFRAWGDRDRAWKNS